MHVTTVRSRVEAFLFNGYRKSNVLQWLRGLTLRNHWRQIHGRDSCVYGFASLWAFLVDLFRARAGILPCDGQLVEQFESALASTLGVKHLVTFSSGRNSLRAILKAMDIGEGDEVILPGFTCVVVPYTILHCGARPVYVDIGRDYRLNLDLVRTSVTPKTKAIIAQHTFGLAERMADIVTLARARGIRVIEDCTHVLPGTKHSGKILGTWGDAAFFSFERGKTISSGWGGAAVTGEEWIGFRLRQMQQSVTPLTRDDNSSIGARLFLTLLVNHPDLSILLNLLRPWLYRKGVFPNSVPASECQGDPPRQLLGRLADIQASLLLRQLKWLPSISERRRACVRALAERLGGTPTDLPLMWYPFQVPDRDEAMAHLRNYQIEPRTWEAPLTPDTCDTARALFRQDDYPTAEEVSRGCVALPTMMQKADLKRVIAVASRYLESRVR